MYMSYMLYQAERVKTVKEQREEDIQTGQLAAEFGRLFRSLGTAARAGSEGSGGRGDGFALRRVFLPVHQATSDLRLTGARVRSP